MKNGLLSVAILAAVILAPSAARAGNYVFSVCPGQAVESAQLGLSMGKVMPYVGFDILGVAAKANYTYDAGT